MKKEKVKCSLSVDPLSSANVIASTFEDLQAQIEDLSSRYYSQEDARKLDKKVLKLQEQVDDLILSTYRFKIGSAVIHKDTLKCGIVIQLSSSIEFKFPDKKYLVYFDEDLLYDLKLPNCASVYFDRKTTQYKVENFFKVPRMDGSLDRRKSYYKRGIWMSEDDLLKYQNAEEYMRLLNDAFVKQSIELEKLKQDKLNLETQSYYKKKIK